MRPEKSGAAGHVILMCQPESAGDGPQDPPLSTGGRAAARSAAAQMYGAGHHPGPLLVSASRAGQETAAIIAEAVHLGPLDIHLSTTLQGASTDQLEVEIRGLAVEYTLVTLVAFNPGVSELARILSQDPQVPALQPGQWRHCTWPPPY